MLATWIMHSVAFDAEGCLDFCFYILVEFETTTKNPRRSQFQPKPIEKKGSCPPRVDEDTCVTCQIDTDCRGMRKCCDGCCRMPVKKRQLTRWEQVFEVFSNGALWPFYLTNLLSLRLVGPVWTRKWTNWAWLRFEPRILWSWAKCSTSE